MTKFRFEVMFVALALLTSWQCRGQTAIEDIESPPKLTQADKKYANVFRPLDGAWQGEFQIFVDERGQTQNTARPKGLTPKIFEDLPLQLQQTIEVRQVYTSESPYFQRVTIWDTYFEDGEKRVVESKGVNKVQNGRLWCIVVKPDEIVVHSGHLKGERTIVWRRQEHQPLKIEYFKESVLEDRYTILGWGYYGDDNPDLSPRHWFKGEYNRAAQK